MSSTKLQLRQASSQLVHPWFASTVTSGTTLTLIDTTWPVQNNEDTSTLYVGWCVYRPNATLASDKVRRVLSYDPVNGQFTVDLAWTNAPTAAEAYEMLAVLDGNEIDNLVNETLKITSVVHEFTITPGFNNTRQQLNARQQVLTISGTPTAGTYTLTYNSQTTAAIPYNADPVAVQTALRLLAALPQVVVTATGTAPNYAHTIKLAATTSPTLAVSVDASGVTGGTFSMGALTNPQAWLTEPKWVRQIGWLTPTSEPRAEVNPYIRMVRGDLVKYDDQVWIEHFGQYFDPYNTTLYVKCVVPAYYLCATAAGSWGAQSGLSAETDLAIPQADWVAAGVRMLAWQWWGLYLAPGDKDRASMEQTRAAAIFASLSESYLDVPIQWTRPSTSWGPPPIGWSGFFS